MTDTFDREKTLSQIAMSLEQHAQDAWTAHDLQLAAQFAQAAGLYHCAHALTDICTTLEAWPVPDA